MSLSPTVASPSVRYGSWARGASECGDLDLAAQFDYAWAEPALRGGKHPVEVSSFLPDFDAIRKAMLGSRPHVHVLDLKWVLEHGKSGEFAVDPESLVLIWRHELDGQPAHDWRAAIEAIKPQAQGTRAPRLTDALPLLVEQTAMDLRHAENAVHAHQAGLLAWELEAQGSAFRSRAKVAQNNCPPARSAGTPPPNENGTVCLAARDGRTPKTLAGDVVNSSDTPEQLSSPRHVARVPFHPNCRIHRRPVGQANAARCRRGPHRCSPCES